ncbi:hypothetical protein GIB67_030371 [Kingdonia uniflora]|uniref:Origin of replication complex subunit 3 n=1 Tax=Kingdonia uniflora TaxID=39325 RepID=A0A7J7M6Y3_9MAGN|nr:hypothetical protein GIB67_030371 [Kingdonia uniflora]
MSSSSPSSPSSPLKISDTTENNLQPFYVLHKAFPKKPDRKTRKKIEFSPTSDTHHHYDELRVEAFELVWSKIDARIKGVLTDINTNVFDEIHQWVCESFGAIRSLGVPSSLEVNRSYPLVTDITSSCSRRIFTGLVFTKNVEFVDDLLTFKELGVHLKSNGCHVVNMSSLDFLSKNGIGGCVRSVLRQLVGVSVDVGDIGILAAWYSEIENFESPIVVIIDDVERCSESVLAEFVLMLSEWVVKLPIVLVMGVSSFAKIVNAPRDLLPFGVLQHLNPCKFTLGSPTAILDGIIESLFVKSYCGFDISYKVMVLMKNYFVRHDGTVTSFIRALKIACTKHFLMEPLSFLSKGILDEDNESFWIEKCGGLPESMLKYAFDLPSCEISDEISLTGESLARDLSEIMKMRKNWSSVFMCLYEAAKFHNVQLLEILCEALNPDSYNLRVSSNRQSGVGELYSVDQKGSQIYLAIRKVRDLSFSALSRLVQFWKNHSERIAEIHCQVIELESMLNSEHENKSLKLDETKKSRISASRTREKNTTKANEKAATLLEFMVKEYLKPVECAQFHEIVCFKHVGVLQSSLIGDPRKIIQVDLLKSHNYLHCSCCSKSGDVLLPSMHDTSIMYTLVQEHGDLINLHDWYQSFKTNICRPSTKGKRKIQSPLSKKRKELSESEVMSEASIQARFCRAVIELQITGLLRMPSKRRPDYVQRVAFGL